ncbi:MAG: tyrosine-type recombinase/integrase, partial [Halanaerobiales bacterium]
VLHNEDYLFQSRKGKNQPISRVQAYRVLKKIGKRAGLNIKIGTHTLRKTYGYHHYQKYKDIAQLQAIFNHSSPDITLDYIGTCRKK